MNHVLVREVQVSRCTQKVIYKSRLSMGFGRHVIYKIQSFDGF